MLYTCSTGKGWQSHSPSIGGASLQSENENRFVSWFGFYIGKLSGFWSLKAHSCPMSDSSTIFSYPQTSFQDLPRLLLNKIVFLCLLCMQHEERVWAFSLDSCFPIYGAKKGFTQKPISLCLPWPCYLDSVVWVPLSWLMSVPHRGLLCRAGYPPVSHIAFEPSVRILNTAELKWKQ